MTQWMRNPSLAGLAYGTPAIQQAYAQPSEFAKVFGQNYGNMTQGMAGLGNSYANAYGSYATGLGSVATARANEASARYGANALAEAARQGALGNIGSAALGAYGSASNSALAAWAANQQAYNNAAASMQMANQQGMSQLGASRNNALGSLGNAYGTIGKAQIASDALANFNLSGNFGDSGGGGADGFSATGPNGPIASGSYGGSGGSSPGGFSFSGSRSSSSGGTGGGAALSGLSGLQTNLMSNDFLNSMREEAATGRRQLDDQHYSSRSMPSQMLNQTLGGLMQLGDRAYGQNSSGMSQFYNNNRMDDSPYRSVLDRLASGYATAGGQIGGAQGDIRSGYASANSAVQNLFDDSIGTAFDSPTQLRRQQQMDDMRRQYKDAQETRAREARDAAAEEERRARRSADQRTLGGGIQGFLARDAATQQYNQLQSRARELYGPRWGGGPGGTPMERAQNAVQQARLRQQFGFV